ncbi:MAG: argininosuccinate lyase, partial [Pseudomonadota bacterium]
MNSDETNSGASNSLWGGRFQGSVSGLMAGINASIRYDKRLFRQDIAASSAHIRMLATQQIVCRQDCAQILKGLREIECEIDEGRFQFSEAFEDIHMNIEARLSEKIGSAGARLHTARSRNDQVATDLRLWLREEIDQLSAQLRLLMRSLALRGGEYAATPMPGFTHLQIAQPVTFGHHLLAYLEMFGRDHARLADARGRVNQSPLGAAALAGTSFAIDREAPANELGFDEVMANSMDAVSARDFVLEFLGAAAICATHLSRLAEEMVIWTSQGFNFIAFSDAFTTGSSIMPQKRNPDAAELIRAKPGRILGAFVALVTVLKGLPMTYSKDMQEDKEILFDACDNLKVAVAVMDGLVCDMQARPEAMYAALQHGFPTATDLADWLVRKKGFAFRDAHHSTGRIVRLAEQKGCQLEA